MCAAESRCQHLARRRARRSIVHVRRLLAAVRNNEAAERGQAPRARRVAHELRVTRDWAHAQEAYFAAEKHWRKARTARADLRFQISHLKGRLAGARSGWRDAIRERSASSRCEWRRSAASSSRSGSRRERMTQDIASTSLGVAQTRRRGALGELASATRTPPTSCAASRRLCDAQALGVARERCVAAEALLGVVDQRRADAPDRPLPSSGERAQRLVARVALGRDAARVADHAAQLGGRISWPCCAPAEVEMLSFISVPPRSLAPQTSSHCACAQAFLDPRGLQVAEARARASGAQIAIKPHHVVAGRARAHVGQHAASGAAAPRRARTTAARTR